MDINATRTAAFKAFGERKYAEALTAFLDLQKHEPANLVVTNNVAVCLKHMGEFVMAADLLAMVMERAPKATDPLRNLAACLMGQCRIGEAIEVCQRALMLHPMDPMTFSNLIYFISYAEAVTPAILHDAAQQFGTLFACDRPRDKRTLWKQRARPKGETVEVAIISPDIRKHSVAYFLQGLLAKYDHSRYGITLCIDGPEPTDAVTQALTGLVDTVLDIRNWKDKAVAREFDKRKIVIAVDLAGHTAFNRLPLFAKRIAPIQVSWLGYIGTTGVKEMDYRLVDPWTELPEEYSTERQAILPHGLHCFTPMKDLPGLTPNTGPIKFCNFSNLGKVNRSSLKRWAKVLAQVPDSTLWLKAHGFQSDGVRKLWHDIAIECGIPEARLTMDPPTRDHRSYLAELEKADIWLDTQPYASATTACEAFWSGVPVISMAGKTAASNLGRSIAMSAGYPDMTYETEEGFIWRAVQLAKDRTALEGYRLSCRANLSISPLFSKKLFATEVMAAFDRMIDHETEISDRAAGAKAKSVKAEEGSE